MAHDDIESLRAENRRLRELLEPFKQTGRPSSMSGWSEDEDRTDITVGMCRYVYRELEGMDRK